MLGTKGIARQRFSQSLRISKPIIQAPMAGVTSPKMVAEVCNNGALGSLPVSHINLTLPSGLPTLRNLINELRRYTNNCSVSQSINLNFFCHEPVLDISPEEKENWCSLYQHVSGVAIDRKLFTFKERSVSFKEYEGGQAFSDLLSFFQHEFRPKVLSFHFGHPTKESIQALQELGIQVYVTATSVDEYELLHELGVDGIICQGYEAGGHRGNFIAVDERFDEKLSTACLVKRILQLEKQNDKSPFIIPAGGLCTAKDVNYMFEIGAAAVQLGTAFLGTLECQASKALHQIIHGEGEKEPTLMIGTVSGKNARAISSPFLRALHSVYTNESLPDYAYMYNAFKRLKKMYPDKVNFTLASQNYLSVKTRISVAELLEELSR